MATGNVNKEGTIELSRFKKILKFCKINITTNVLWEAIELTRTSTEILDERDDKIKYKGLLYYYFWKIVHEVACEIQTAEDEDSNRQKINSSEISDSEDNAEETKTRDANKSNIEPKQSNNKAEANGANTSQDQTPQNNNPGNHEDAEDLKEENAEEDDLPTLEEDWNYGPFEVNIIRCWNCTNHYDYCRHSEDEYVDKFNAIANDITERFPEAVITGNYEKPSYLEWFDIYLRGAGPAFRRDNQGRFFIFRKSKAKRFPTAKEVIDYLIIFAMLYGGAGKLGKAQDDFKSKYRYLIPRPCELVHDNPAVAPADVRKQHLKKKKGNQVGDRVMICKNWGWGREYQEDKNEK